jgi:uncharacterized coiled-coil DUF342 family protein
MATAAELATKIEQLRADLADYDATIKGHRDALKSLVAERDQIIEAIAEAKKARFSAIAAEEKAEKIAKLRAELAKLEGDDSATVASEPTPVLSLVA